MTTTQDKIVQYLHEAHAMELALARTLQAHSAMTPAGAYRTALERHRRETREHADRLARRLGELGHGRSLAEAGYGLVQRLAGQLLALGKAPLDVVRGASGEEKLLKNAKDECASEALEIATYDAIEQLARQAGDETTAALAAELRADEERMLATLRELLPALSAAVVGAEVRGEMSYDAGTTGAARALRDGRQAAGEAARDAVHAARSATGTLDGLQEREEHRSPLPGYDGLNVEEVAARLDGLTPAQLRHVATYERAHKRRRTVLDAVERRKEEREREKASA
jgi:ferritin-like metal-binding protein YciE